VLESALEFGEHGDSGIGQKQQTEVRRHVIVIRGGWGDREGERRERRKSEEDANRRARPIAQASGHCNTKRRRGTQQ
jgi:hypothetical protein